MEDGNKEVVAACLQNPYMTEGEIYKVISKRTVTPQVIRQIAEHPKWSSRHQVQLSLIRHCHTPLSRIVIFLKNIKTSDLKELYEDPDVPSSTKPCIYRELLERDEK